MSILDCPFGLPLTIMYCILSRLVLSDHYNIDALPAICSNLYNIDALTAICIDIYNNDALPAICSDL